MSEMPVDSGYLFLLIGGCPHMIEGVMELSGASSVGTNPTHGGLHPHDLITPKPPPPNTIMLGVRFQYRNVVERTYALCLALSSRLAAPLCSPISHV